MFSQQASIKKKKNGSHEPSKSPDEKARDSKLK